MVEIQPEDPIAFSSEFFLHSAHNSQTLFKAFKLASKQAKYDGKPVIIMQLIMIYIFPTFSA